MQKIGVVNFTKPLYNDGSKQAFKLPSFVRKINTMFIVLNNIRLIQGLIHFTSNFNFLEASVILNNDADFKFRLPIQFATLFNINDFTNLNSFISTSPFSGFEIPINSTVNENANHTVVFELDRNFKNIPEYNGILKTLVYTNLTAELYYTYND